MSEPRRLVAAFYLPVGVRPVSAAALRRLARRATVKELEEPPWDTPEQPALLGSWGGLDCEVHLLDLDYFDGLVLTFREDELRTARTMARPGADPLVDAFGNACGSLDPVSAYLTAYAWPDPFWYVRSQQERVLDGHVAQLARENLGLLYVSATDAPDLAAVESPAGCNLLAVGDGVLLLCPQALGR
ncbi:hypothetical protein AB0J86_19920 [Micromonospora sp. NPDC049559]|uniref:hypothetical protein n=1 Tax=Micromonospora sp. NPDC049559 TaxID=3155923 RepID=UPI00343F440B